MNLLQISGWNPKLFNVIEIVICRTQTIGMKMFKELLIQRQRTEAGFLINSTIPIVTAFQDFSISSPFSKPSLI